MCGIFGYIGPRNPKQVCLEGLKQLEYRGYDSAGFAGILGSDLVACKEVGKLEVLEAALSSYEALFSLGVAHTRWATHGEPSKENAHPHFDETGAVAIVHNGIIENHLSLKEFLQSKGKKFYSDTDTEVIAQLVSYYYEGDLLVAAQKAFSQMRGSWGIALIHKNHPHQIIAAAKENPIIVGYNTDRTEVFVSSDVHAFQDPSLDVLFLGDEEIALLSPSHFEIITKHYEPIEKAVHRLQLHSTIASKNGYPHFMLKEIFEQAETLFCTLEDRYSLEEGNALFPEITFTAKELATFTQIVIIACGTSLHAGQIGAQFMEQTLGIPVRAEIASEFRYRTPAIDERTLVIAISQSGETLDTLAALREAKRRGAAILGICNVPNSSLAREAHSTLFLKAGREISVCSTKTFTSQVAVLSLLTLFIGREKKISQEEGIELLKEMQALPRKIQQVLNLHTNIHRLALKYSAYEHLFFLGRHFMYTTCLEAALKLKEISYIHAQGYPAGEMKHGPIALVDPNLPVIFFCGNALTLEKTMSNLSEIKARKAPILAFAPENTQDIDLLATDTVFLPVACDPLSPILYSVAGQLFAYYVAIAKGTDIDQPRNLAKSVTVE
ncbi:MAG: glucosamine--fructose-6-phosphate aminotransferase [Chlamydiota bacterium]|jgi:glucosamine--fructose-6-phosphate aminotransferase (isomerizing)